MCRTLNFFFIAAILLLGTSLAGCADPYSQKRIQRRNTHLQAFFADCAESEQRRPTRLREAGKRLRDWHQSDCEQFNKRMPTIGDYVL